MKNKILTALLSVVIALGLWLYVVTVVSPNSEKTIYNIPVGLQNESLLEERGLMITTAEQPTVNLRLAGNRLDLDKLSSANITVSANVAGVYQAGKYDLPYDISFPGDIPNNAISTQKRTPDTVTLVVEERVSKTVGVEVLYIGTQAEGFSVDKENIDLDYKEIEIVGPKRLVDTVEKARITVNLQGVKESITNTQLPYVLLDSMGRSVSSPFVEDRLGTDGMITVNNLRIVRVKEIRLVAKVVDGGGATDQTSEIVIEPEMIIVSGSEKMLEDMGNELEVGVIELANIPADDVLTFPLKLPEGVTCESGETEAKAHVRFPDLRTKTLTITQITPVNVPSGLRASVITRMLDIQFRGPKALIDQMEADNVRVTVDFSGAKAGTETKPVTIAMDSEFAQVGAVGAYTVSATVSNR